MTEHVLLTRLPFHLAHIVKGALEADGIPTTMDRQSFDAYGLDSGQFATGLFVAAEDVERARALLTEIEGQAEVDTDFDPS